MVGQQRITRNAAYDRLRNPHTKVTPHSLDKLNSSLISLSPRQLIPGMVIQTFKMWWDHAFKGSVHVGWR